MRVCHPFLVFKDLVGIWLLESENDDQVIETLFELLSHIFIPIRLLFELSCSYHQPTL